MESLEIQAYRAVLNLKKAHAQKELDELSFVLSVCPLGNENYDKILEWYEIEFNTIKNINKALKEI